MDISILLENTPLVKFIQNYIWDVSGIFSISLLVRILMMSFLAFSQFVQSNIFEDCLYNKKEFTWWLQAMNLLYLTHCVPA